MTAKKKPARIDRRNRLIERYRASKLPRGAGLMYLFCCSIERGKQPDPEVTNALVPLFRAAIAVVQDGAKDRQGRIITALDLKSQQGRRKATREDIERQCDIAREVERLRRAPGYLVKVAELEVAKKHAMKHKTVHQHYIKWKALAKTYVDVEVAGRHLIERYGGGPFAAVAGGAAVSPTPPVKKLM